MVRSPHPESSSGPARCRATASSSSSVEQAGAEQVPDVAGQDVDRLLAVRRGPAPGSGSWPVPHQNRVPEPRRPVLRPSCRYASAAEPAERVQQGGAADRRLVRVALHLAERDRAGGDPAVGEPDRVRRVLPALVGQSAASCVDVLQEAVAVRIAVVGHPAQSAPRASAAALRPRRPAPRPARRRAARRSTAGWRRWCRSRAAEAPWHRGRIRTRRSSCGILPGSCAVRDVHPVAGQPGEGAQRAHRVRRRRPGAAAARSTASRVRTRSGTRASRRRRTCSRVLRGWPSADCSGRPASVPATAAAGGRGDRRPGGRPSPAASSGFAGGGHHDAALIDHVDRPPRRAGAPGRDLQRPGRGAGSSRPRPLSTRRAPAPPTSPRRRPTPRSTRRASVALNGSTGGEVADPDHLDRGQVVRQQHLDPNRNRLRQQRGDDHGLGHLARPDPALPIQPDLRVRRSRPDPARCGGAGS